jgi:hypothetical protein
VVNDVKNNYSDHYALYTQFIRWKRYIKAHDKNILNSLKNI